MKKCPFCAEEIKDEAVKCKHCGSELKKSGVSDEEFEEIRKKALSTVNKETKTKNLKILLWIVFIFATIFFWYFTLPILLTWLVWKKTKLDRKKKLISIGGIIVFFIVIVGIKNYITRAPKITITEPENNFSIQAESIAIKGKVSPKNSQIIFNGITLATTEGNFEYKAELFNEKNSFVFSAKNGKKESKATITVNRIFTEEELTKREEERKKQEELAKVKQEKIIEQQKTKAINTLTGQLQKEINAINNFDNTALRGSVDKLYSEVIMFSILSKLVNETKIHSNNEIKKLSSTLENKLKQLQIKEFPLMRKNYGEISNKLVWADNIEVKVYGTYNSTIELVSGAFANNKNIIDAYIIISEILKTLRFDRANFKWYKYDDDYTYYEIESIADNQLRELSEYAKDITQ